MVDGRRRGLFGKALCLAAATVSGGLLLGAANLPLAGAATSSSSSGGGGVPDSACSGVKERCLADPFCTGCTTGIGSRRRERSRRRLQQQSGGDDDANGSSSEQEQEASTELCSSRYPILVSGSGISFCERVGAAKCCEFSDNDTASTCLEDSLTAEYWSCFLVDEVSCDVSDMPCHPSHRVTAAPTTAAPAVFMTPSPTAPQIPASTAAPTASAATATPTVGPTVAAAAATPSPTAGSRGGLDIPTPGPTDTFDADEIGAGGDDIDAADGEANAAAPTFGGLVGPMALAGGVGVVVVAFLSEGGLGVSR